MTLGSDYSFLVGETIMSKFPESPHRDNKDMKSI